MLPAFPGLGSALGLTYQYGKNKQDNAAYGNNRIFKFKTVLYMPYDLRDRCYKGKHGIQKRPYGYSLKTVLGILSLKRFLRGKEGDKSHY